MAGVRDQFPLGSTAGLPRAITGRSSSRVVEGPAAYSETDAPGVAVPENVGVESTVKESSLRSPVSLAGSSAGDVPNVNVAVAQSPQLPAASRPCTRMWCCPAESVARALRGMLA